MDRKYVSLVQKVSFHRNGVGGAGFYAVLFVSMEGEQMVASLFDEPDYCAVYQVNKLADGDVEFGSNSWRGDNFECELRPMVEEWLKEHSTNRLGPFSIPSEKSLSEIFPKGA